MSSNITKGDEAAAMAAMFQAQTANWEETQEKMSQLVLPSGAICFLRSSPLLMNIAFALFSLSPLVSPHMHV
jgi:protein MPE1